MPYPSPPKDLTEFKELADSAGVTTLSILTGRVQKPRPKFFIGKGKAEELQAQVVSLEAEVVLFNHELTPAQGRNLEKLLNCRVLDRTELILDIFAQRARTFEGKLQVELAQLQHLKTCLVRGWTHLERQKGGIGLRGPGETQLETDRRLLNARIKSIQQRLAKVMNQRDLRRRARKRASMSTVSLVGYTNAGKSTLFNRLTLSDVYVADQLFATLDPTLRILNLPQIGKFVLADTVGFIRDLPHDLVAAFRATLEETRQADLLLHVIDSHAEDTQALVHDVDRVLAEIGASAVPQLQVMNKVDLCQNFEPRIDYCPNGRPKRVWLSALTGNGMDLLLQAIQDALKDRLVSCEITLEHHEGKLRAKLYELNVVKHEHIDEQGKRVLNIEIQQADYNRLLAKRGE